MAQKNNLIETTLERLTKQNHASMKVLLRYVYCEIKQMPNARGGSWCKMIMRFVDKEGKGLYAELRASDASTLKKVADPWNQDVFYATHLKPVSNNKFFAGLYVDLSDRASRAKVIPVASSHPSAMEIKTIFPLARSDFSVLATQCQGRERVDVIGLVTELEMPNTSKPKANLWLKDTSGKEMLVNIWGDRFVKSLANAHKGSVVQIDNLSLLKKENDSIEGAAEHFIDNDKHGFSMLHVDPIGDRARELRDLEPTQGDRISVPWCPSLSGGGKLTTDFGPCYVACAATMNAFGSAMEQGSTQDCLREKVEVALHNVWLVDIVGDPVYTPCKVCSTKIDPTSGKCKRATDGCQTEPADAQRVLATVHLADWTGQLSNVLVGGPELAALARVRDEEKLVELIQLKGSEAVCFRGPCDARLGTSHRLGQPRGGSAQQASQASVTGGLAAPTQFQVLAARACFGEEYDEDRRPMVKKVTRLATEKRDGAVLPVQCPIADLMCSDMGTFFKLGGVFANYVTVVAFAEDEPTVEEVFKDEEKHLLTKHKEVYSHTLERVGDRKAFGIEAFCQFTNCFLFNMADGLPRLILGRVIKNAATQEVVLQVEWMSKVTPEQIKTFSREREMVWNLLKGGPALQSNKRPASSLVQETPSKVKCSAWEMN
ncbi:unnamed protein product [Symbiodinium sp. CCMP2592]|nr:unnamed protein product [Symbiodinium sp. CCMP2592]